MMKKIPSTKLWLLLSLALFIAATSFDVFIRMSYKGIKEEADALALTINESKAKSIELQAIEANLKSTLASKDRLASLFLTSDTVIGFIESLEFYMDESGVVGEVRDVSDAPTGEENGIPYYSFTVFFEGSLQETLRYIGVLENMPYLLSVESFIANTEEGTWTTTLSLRVASLIYEN